MKLAQVYEKYPNLKDLYIPERGEIIRWGKGAAITAQSPLEERGGELLVFTLNTEPTDTIRVHKNFAMGPYEPLDLETQIELVTNDKSHTHYRLKKLFKAHPWMKDYWEKYRKEKEKV